MHVHEVVIPIIGISMTCWGALFLMGAGALTRIEGIINRPVSLTYVFALRLGWRCEHLLEGALNRPVLQRSIRWDGFVQRNPRAFGAALLVAGCVLLLSGA